MCKTWSASYHRCCWTCRRARGVRRCEVASGTALWWTTFIEVNYRLPSSCRTSAGLEAPATHGQGDDARHRHERDAERHLLPHALPPHVPPKLRAGLLEDHRLLTQQRRLLQHSVQTLSTLQHAVCHTHDRCHTLRAIRTTAIPRRCAPIFWRATSFTLSNSCRIASTLSTFGSLYFDCLAQPSHARGVRHAHTQQ
jgi:hypothetical protein